MRGAVHRLARGHAFRTQQLRQRLACQRLRPCAAVRRVPAAILQRGGGKQVTRRLDRGTRLVRIVERGRHGTQPGRLGGSNAIKQDFGPDQMLVVGRMAVAGLADRQEEETKACTLVADHRWPDTGDESCSGRAHKPTCSPDLRGCPAAMAWI